MYAASTTAEDMTIDGQVKQLTVLVQELQMENKRLHQEMATIRIGLNRIIANMTGPKPAYGQSMDPLVRRY